LIVGPRGLEEIVEVFGVAEVGEIRRRNNENVVGTDQRLPGPTAPQVRHGIEYSLKRVGAEIVNVVERRRRRQQAQMVGTFGEQPVDKGVIDAVGRKHRFGDALRRVLVEIEAGGAEREIEVGDHRIEHEIAGDGKSDIVRNR
jgi:hypothetical protein